MTGAYIRVKREDSFENIEIEHLTDKERKELFKNTDKEPLISWINLLCNSMVHVEEQLRITENALEDIQYRITSLEK